MATVEELAPAYFASMNSIAKKIMKDQEALKDLYKQDWERLDFDKQEQLIDDHIVDSTIREFYKDHPQAEEVPQYFPKLVIDSGEKIIIDFDNDGWTWQDEHSAPFSWETKSHMNMPMTESGEDTKAAKLRKIKRPKSPKFDEQRRSGTPATPSLKSSGASGIWNSPFMAADRGDDADFSGKQEDEHRPQSFVNSGEGERTEDDKPMVVNFSSNSSEDLFKKYGISFGNRASPAKSIDQESISSRTFDKEYSPARSVDIGFSSIRSASDRTSPSRSTASVERSSPSRFARLSPKRVINRKSKDREIETTLVSGTEDAGGVVNLALNANSDSDSEKNDKSSNHGEFGVINYGQCDQTLFGDYSKAFETVNLSGDLTTSLDNQFSEMQMKDVPETDLIDETTSRGSIYDNCEEQEVENENVSSLQDSNADVESGEPGSLGISSKTGFDFLDNW